MVRVEVTVVRIHATGDRQSSIGMQDRPNNRRIPRSIVFRSDQRLDDAAALDFMVILADDPMFAGNIQAAQDRQ